MNKEHQGKLYCDKVSDFEYIQLLNSFGSALKKLKQSLMKDGYTVNLLNVEGYSYLLKVVGHEGVSLHYTYDQKIKRYVFILIKVE